LTPNQSSKCDGIKKKGTDMVFPSRSGYYGPRQYDLIEKYTQEKLDRENEAAVPAGEAAQTEGINE
jgi:hypothetical protein